ncbi:MAG: hypothetical protein K1X75_02330 [Leptospirales bacterium]|nr:hypothetical protein [Leptospirales bacterium]
MNWKSASRSLFFWCLRHFSWLAAGALFLYIFWRGMAQGAAVALLLALPPVALGAAAIALLGRWMIGRMQLISLRPLPELILLLLSAAFLILTQALRAGPWSMPVLLGFLAAALLALRLGRTGIFVTTTLGLAMLALLVSLLLLHAALERGWLYLQYSIQQSERSLSAEEAWQADQQGAWTMLSGRSASGQWLRLRLPSRLHWSDGIERGFVYGAPELGRALLYISARREDPLAPPALVLYLSPELGQEEMASKLAASLQHRRNLGEVRDIHCGENFSASLAGGAEAHGAACRYRDQVNGALLRLAALPILRGNTHYIVLLIDPQTEGFPMHPELAAILQSLTLR